MWPSETQERRRGPVLRKDYQYEWGMRGLSRVMTGWLISTIAILYAPSRAY